MNLQVTREEMLCPHIVWQVYPGPDSVNTFLESPEPGHGSLV